MAVDRQARLAVRTQVDDPAPALPTRVGVGRDEFRHGRAVLRAGLRVERADQGDRRVDFRGVRLQLLGQARAIVARERFQMAADDLARGLPALQLRIERVELHAQAFAQIAAGDADRVEMLDAPAHRLDFRHGHRMAVDRGQASERRAQRVGVLVQIAVLVDRLDDRGADRAVAQ